MELEGLVILLYAGDVISSCPINDVLGLHLVC
jgi:hypothetical protein